MGNTYTGTTSQTNTNYVAFSPCLLPPCGSIQDISLHHACRSPSRSVQSKRIAELYLSHQGDSARPATAVASHPTQPDCQHMLSFEHQLWLDPAI